MLDLAFVLTRPFSNDELTFLPTAHKLLPALGKLLRTPSSGGTDVGFDLTFWASDPFADVSPPSIAIDASVAQAHSLQLDDSEPSRCFLLGSFSLHLHSLNYASLPPSAYCFLSNDSIPGIAASLNFAQLVGLYTPDRDGDYELGVTCDGKARIFVDGKLIVDNWDQQTRGE